MGLKQDILSADRLRQLLDYDSQSGAFIWREKPCRNVQKGARAGTIQPNGYRTIRIDGFQYLEQRLAWLYMHGEWPLGQVDHINRCISDNSISNLRDVSHSENQQNRGISKNNKSGYKGVSFCRRNGKWGAFITVGGKSKALGYHASPSLAASAYAAGAALFHRINPASVGGN